MLRTSLDAAEVEFAEHNMVRAIFRMCEYFAYAKLTWESAHFMSYTSPLLMIKHINLTHRLKKNLYVRSRKMQSGA